MNGEQNAAFENDSNQVILFVVDVVVVLLYGLDVPLDIVQLISTKFEDPEKIEINFLSRNHCLGITHRNN